MSRHQVDALFGEVESVFAEAETVFAHADTVFRHASKVMDNKSNCRVQSTGQQTVAFRTTSKRERWITFRTFLRMSWDMAWTGSTEIKIVRRDKN